MEEVILGKYYNTDTANLLKYKVEVEDLTNGYTRYNMMGLYSRERSKDYFVFHRKVSIDSGKNVIDDISYIRPITKEVAVRFREYVEFP